MSKSSTSEWHVESNLGDESADELHWLASYPGPTRTGAEPALVQTAPVYPKQSAMPLLVSNAP